MLFRKFLGCLVVICANTLLLAKAAEINYDEYEDRLSISFDRLLNPSKLAIIPRLPFRPQYVDFRLFTRKNRQIPKTISASAGGNFDSAEINLDRSKPTKIIIHGYVANARQRIFGAIKDAYLDRGDYNVVVVDWLAASGGISYLTAVERTRYVGNLIAKFVSAAKLSNVHIIGHSLGAHIAGFAGKKLNGKLQRITGLDPAGPGFDTAQNEPSQRLDAKDAKFVDAIYTNGGRLALFYYGIDFSIAQANFYVNGGKNQPACETILPLRGPMKKMCSHMTALLYFLNSIKFNKYRAQTCNEPNSSKTEIMGEDASPRARGDYCLDASLSREEIKKYIRRILILDPFD